MPAPAPGESAFQGGASPAAYTPMKRSILDRLTAKLWPSLTSFSQADAPGLGRQGLVQFGANLLQAGGPQAQQGGTLANIGAALGGVDLNSLVRQSLIMRQLRQQESANEAIGKAAARNAPKEGETPQQTYERIARMVGELAGTPGTEDLIGKLSNVLAQIRPQGQRERFVVRAGVSAKGQPELFRINLDTGEKTALGIGAIQRVQAGQPTESERRAGALLTVGEDAYNQLKEAKAPSTTDFLATQVPMGLGQAAVSGPQQLQNQAGMQLYRSYLYIVSGASATDREAEAASRTFTPQIGDDQTTIARKAKARNAMLRAMRQAAGRAAQPTVIDEEPDESENLDEFLTTAPP